MVSSIDLTKSSIFSALLEFNSTMAGFLYIFAFPNCHASKKPILTFSSSSFTAAGEQNDRVPRSGLFTDYSNFIAMSECNQINKAKFSITKLSLRKQYYDESQILKVNKKIISKLLNLLNN